MTIEATTEARALPLGTSAQKAKLIALIQALELSKGKIVNIYTILSEFLVSHAHRAIRKERKCLTTAHKEITDSQEILQLLIAIQAHLKWQLYTARSIRRAWISKHQVID